MHKHQPFISHWIAVKSEQFNTESYRINRDCYCNHSVTSSRFNNRQFAHSLWQMSAFVISTGKLRQFCKTLQGLSAVADWVLTSGRTHFQDLIQSVSSALHNFLSADYFRTANCNLSDLSGQRWNFGKLNMNLIPENDLTFIDNFCIQPMFGLRQACITKLSSFSKLIILALGPSTLPLMQHVECVYMHTVFWITLELISMQRSRFTNISLGQNCPGMLAKLH